MTPRERLLCVLKGGVPDCVPVAPDFSNMIPARLTGKPFWDLYLYNDPPIWEAYIECAKRFGIDSLMDGYFPLTFPEEMSGNGAEWERAIVFRNDERIVVQASRLENGKRVWQDRVTVYYVADPPTGRAAPGKIGLPPVPEKWEPLEGVKPVDRGPEGLKRLYGKDIVLKGNLHTTKLLLHGRPEDVVAASRKAIDDAAEGGGFILSTGDQCGRDTPDENLQAMIETARSYGKY